MGELYPLTQVSSNIGDMFMVAGTNIWTLILQGPLAFIACDGDPGRNMSDWHAWNRKAALLALPGSLLLHLNESYSLSSEGMLPLADGLGECFIKCCCVLLWTFLTPLGTLCMLLGSAVIWLSPGMLWPCWPALVLGLVCNCRIVN